MIDKSGFRKNVGIILTKNKGQVLFAKRAGQESAWQFPQGGIDHGETIEQALYRELEEEVGLLKGDVKVIAESQQWLSYEIPEKFRRRSPGLPCIGQTQKWFLLQLITDESKIHLDNSKNPEFDDWRWVDYRYPADHVIAFKQAVYRQIMEEFDEFLSSA